MHTARCAAPAGDGDAVAVTSGSTASRALVGAAGFAAELQGGNVVGEGSLAIVVAAVLVDSVDLSQSIPLYYSHKEALFTYIVDITAAAAGGAAHADTQVTGAGAIDAVSSGEHVSGSAIGVADQSGAAAVRAAIFH